MIFFLMGVLVAVCSEVRTPGVHVFLFLRPLWDDGDFFLRMCRVPVCSEVRAVCVAVVGLFFQ